MKNKIDANLLKRVNALSYNKKVECIVYVQNFCLAEKFLHKYFDGEYTKYPFINAFKIDMNLSNILKVAKLNMVKYVSSNAYVSTLVNVSKQIMNVDKVTNIQSSFSTVIIDTGLYPHLDFMIPKNNVLYFKDFINEKTKIYDDNGHGTFVAGILCGKGIVSGNTYNGIDNKSNLIILKALDKNGETSASIILNAMQWVYDNKHKYNIKLVNMSFGSIPLGENDPLIVGAEALWDSGIVVVSACGNSGPETQTIRSPGASTKIITVGALDDKRQLVNDGEDKILKYNFNEFEVADFSSRGPVYNNYKPDLLAPGVEIMGACNFKLNKSFYTTMSGTSVATPMITGVCSLLLKQYPKYSPNQIKKLLLSSCTQITGDRNSEGFGWFNGKLFKK